MNDLELSPAEVAGWTGAVLCLVAYALVSTGRLDGKGTRFALMNMAGGALLAWNGYEHRALPAVFVNVVWLTIGAVSYVVHRRHSGS